MFNSASSQEMLKDMIFCSITGMIFLDPVVVDSGQIYEREAIQKHFIHCYQHNKQYTCPKTNLLISDKMIPSVTSRQLVENYLKNFPEQKEQQYVVIDKELYLPVSKFNFFQKYAYQEVFQLPAYVIFLNNSLVNEDLIHLAVYSETEQLEAKQSFLSALNRHSQPTNVNQIMFDNKSFTMSDIREAGPIVNLATRRLSNLNAVFLFVESEQRLSEILLRIFSTQSFETCKIELNQESQHIILTSTNHNVELQASELKLTEAASLLTSMLMNIRQNILNFNTTEQTSRVGCVVS